MLARDGFRCRAGVVAAGACDGPLDVHELAPRSVYPGGHLDVTNCVTICRSHHRWVDANPEAAHAIGLHKYSWET